MTVTAARHAVNAAALARDRVALVALGASLPATTAYAYERHRARAYAHALEDSSDAALGELAVGAASMPPSAAVLAADGAGLQLLLGNPARSIASIALAARSDAPFDDFGREVLLASTREAPTEWRRAARAAALVRHPRAALVAISAAFDAMGDRRAYRIALATAGLLTALVALLALPTLLVDGGTPVAGVTAPSFAAPPSVVVVPARPQPPQTPPRNPIATIPPFVGGPTVLVSSSNTSQPSPSPSESAGRPRTVRPGPAAAPPAAPSPSPTPGPAPQPGPQPAAPQPGQPPVSLAVAQPAAAPAPAAPPAQPKANKGKGKAKGHAKQAAKAAATAAPPQQAAAAPPSAAPAPQPTANKGKSKAKAHAKPAAMAAPAAAVAPQPAPPAPEAQPPASAEASGQSNDDKHDKSDKDKKNK
jgi:hypothetical protein